MWANCRPVSNGLDEEPAVRVVILAANGNHFCAGIDLAMLGGGYLQ